MGRKNIQGGNKTKGMARNRNYNNKAIRIPESEEEEYAIVTSVSGNGRFRVQTQKKINYTGVLPGSMRGNKKRNNYVQLHSIILINNRSSWQTMKEGCPVDILNIYNDQELDQLDLKEAFKDHLYSCFNSATKLLDDSLVQFQNTENKVSTVVQIDNNKDTDIVEEDEGFDLDLI